MHKQHTTNGVGVGNLVVGGPLLLFRNSGALLGTSGRIIMTSSTLRKMLRFFMAWPKLMKPYALNFSRVHLLTGSVEKVLTTSIVY
jgi:hypothetical protein